MEDYKPINPPMVTRFKLKKYDESLEAYQTMYRSMIDILLYVISSRLDVMHAVGLVARFQYAPTKKHVQAIKSIFKYLKGTFHFGLWYPRGEDITLKIYTDVDWACSVDDRKSTSGGAFFLGNCLVSWLSEKKSSITLFRAKDEYIAAASYCTQSPWMKKTM